MLYVQSIDVMDYSLLVGVDEERHELVLGIIDFMRQYTWDKHLETWVKASGILGGGGKYITNSHFSNVVQETIPKSNVYILPNGSRSVESTYYNPQ